MNALHQPENIKLIIFDWDGTLMDSEAQIVSTMQAAINDLGLETRSNEQCSDIIGLGLKEAIDALYPDSDDLSGKRLVEQYRYHWLENSKPSELFPGVRETLYALKHSGYQIAVATGKGRAGLDKVLAQTDLTDIFDATRCSDETRSKPHPQMLHELLQELKVAPLHTVMVGDTEYDIKMALEASVGPIAVSYGAHNTSRLLQHDLLACIDRIEELTSWLDQSRLNGAVINN